MNFALAMDTVEVDLIKLLQTDVTEAISQGDRDGLRAFISLAGQRLLEGVEVEESFSDYRSRIECRLADAEIKAIIALINSDEGHAAESNYEGLALRLIRLDPAQELGYRVLMEHYCETDRRAMAREIYERCKAKLLVDYGVQPELSTRQLAASLGLESRLEMPQSHQESRISTTANGVPEFTGLVPRIGTPRLMLVAPRLVEEDSSVRHIASALIDDVAGGLTRYRSVAVLAPHTGRVANSADFDSIADKYGLDYLVRTTVKPAHQSLIASFMLVNCRTGVIMTGFDCPFRLDDLPDVFNRLSAEVVTTLVTTIEKAEVELPTATKHKDAYRLFLEGKHALLRVDLPDLRRARNHFQSALHVSNQYAPAMAGIARTLSMERLVRGITDNELLATALEFAERSIHSDPQDSRGFREQGFASLYLRRHDESLCSFEVATNLAPHDADLLADFADALSHSGQPEEALSTCLRSKALNPAHPDYYDWIHASILYQQGKYEDAVRTLQAFGDSPGTARLLAAANAMAGNKGQAAHFANIVVENYPDFRLIDVARLVPDKNANDTRHLLDGLFRAGLR